MSGWYPDPSGHQGRFRYWDGVSWSRDTTTDPVRTPPPAAPPNTDPPNSRSDKGWLIAVVALVIITAVVVAFVLYNTGRSGGTPPIEDTNSAAPTISGWDETSTPLPSTSTPPPSTTGGDWVKCPRSTADGSTAQPSGLLAAGALSVERVPSWQEAAVPYLEWGYDLHRQSIVVVTGSAGTWNNAQAVALLATQDGWQDTATSAQRSMECLATGGNMMGFTGRTDLINEATTITGYDAWHIRSELRVQNNSFPTIPGSVVDIIVIDMGAEDYLGIYMSLCVIGESSCADLLAVAQATLQVS